MVFPRSSGILLHPSSLPGAYGIGTLGKEARRFVDFLAESGTGLWQVLPLGPTGYGDSPYQCLSSFAGNTYLIDPELLLEAGLVSPADAATCRAPETCRVDYGRLFRTRRNLLEAAWKGFRSGAGKGGGGLELGGDDAFRSFCAENASWLEDFVLFMAIKEERNHEPWDRWPESLRTREPAALAEFAAAHASSLDCHRFGQFLFFSQWRALKEYANSKGLSIVGDIPIFAAWDSADVWAGPELFQLDERGLPTKVAGVPPDYFTATGQLWGNPLYDWKAHAKSGYAWWISRIEAAFSLADMVRIDHFRGFSEYWAVPARDATAEGGRWERGPGRALFDAIGESLGELPIIAEDLGFMTPDVHELRDAYGFPGMKILQFAFEPGTDNPDYPHNYPRDVVVYTGTHDNNTSKGWIGQASLEQARRALAYVGGDRRSFAWNMVRTAWASPAALALAPMQDILGLGAQSRMNHPGRQDGYWTWRMDSDSLAPRLARRLEGLNKACFRVAPGGLAEPGGPGA